MSSISAITYPGGGGVVPNVAITLTDIPIITWNFSAGNIGTVTIAGNRTLSIANVPDNTFGALKVIQDSVGGRTLVLPGFIGDLVLSTDPNAEDLLGFFYDGINFYWSITNYGAAPPSLVIIDFTTVTGISESGGVWTVIGGGSSYGNTGLAPTSLGAAIDGIIYLDGNSEQGVLGFSTTNAETGYAGMIAGLVISSSTIYGIDGGVVSSPITSTLALNKYGIRRTGSVLTVEVSTDGGTVWSVLSTLVSSSAANLYIVCDINGAGAIRNPIGVGIS